MAVPLSLYKSNINVEIISRSLNSLEQGLNTSRKTIGKINKDLNTYNDTKRKSLSRSSLLFQRKRENIRRKKQKSLIELSRIRSISATPGIALANTSKSLIGRMMDFAGTIMAGWLVYNLPTIAGMAQELSARVVRLTQIFGNFLPYTGRLVSGFNDVLGAYTTNILTLDFTDNSKRVEKSMQGLNDSFSEMRASFAEALSLITTPLTEPLEGPGAPPFGTKYPEGTPGTGGQLQPIHKQALDIISGPESGGDYNAMNNGQSGDRPGGSKKWLGKDLTDMTIGEIKYHQNVKKDLWAAGRYQIIPGSLPTAQKSAGLKDSDKFDQNNQDLLAIGLLKVQGPGAWTNYSKYSKQEIEIMYKAKNTPLGPAPSTAKPEPSPSRPSTGTMNLVPQTGAGGFIQGGSSAPGKETTYATHFHIDLQTPNYTQEGLAKIREVAFRAIQAMQARGSYVTFGNMPGYPRASTNPSVLKSQILQEQQGHGARSTPGVDIQEHNPNTRQTFPSQVGSATKFPFAVGSVYWRGGYGREAEIIGSDGVTVSHGAPGSTESQAPKQNLLSSTNLSSPKKEVNTAVATAPTRTGPTVILMPQNQPAPQIAASASPSYSQQSTNVPQSSLNSNNMLLTQLAYA